MHAFRQFQVRGDHSHRFRHESEVLPIGCARDRSDMDRRAVGRAQINRLILHLRSNALRTVPGDDRGIDAQRRCTSCRRLRHREGPQLTSALLGDPVDLVHAVDVDNVPGSERPGERVDREHRAGLVRAIDRHRSVGRRGVAEHRLVAIPVEAQEREHLAGFELLPNLGRGIEQSSQRADSVRDSHGVEDGLAVFPGRRVEVEYGTGLEPGRRSRRQDISAIVEIGHEVANARIRTTDHIQRDCTCEVVDRRCENALGEVVQAQRALAAAVSHRHVLLRGQSQRHALFRRVLRADRRAGPDSEVVRQSDAQALPDFRARPGELIIILRIDMLNELIRVLPEPHGLAGNHVNREKLVSHLGVPLS